MTKPTAEQSRGFDIMIWADEGGRILARSQSILGEILLHALMPGHKMGNEIEIEEEPSKFFADIPRKTKIGLVNPETNDVLLVAFGGLH
jgi:hypothetical protein